MATNGIVSIVRHDGKVLFKCVAGCDGDNASKVAEELRKRETYSLKSVYNVCITHGFGCEDCLVVQSETGHVGCEDEGEELHESYVQKFTDPKFNPRRESGFSEHVKIVKLPPVDLSYKRQA